MRPLNKDLFPELEMMNEDNVDDIDSVMEEAETYGREKFRNRS